MNIEYNEEIHIKALYKMLSEKEPWFYCPAKVHLHRVLGIIETELLHKTFSEYKALSCKICRSFVNMDNIEDQYINNKNLRPKSNCPCIALGKDEAIKRTWIKIEEQTK